MKEGVEAGNIWRYGHEEEEVEGREMGKRTEEEGARGGGEE